jgi:hypothetical protein
MKNQELDIEIAETTCLIAEQVYNTNPKTPNNTRINTMARIAVSIHLLKLKVNTVDIAKHLGKDRTSILHYVKTHPDRLKYDSEYKKLHELFLQSIENNEYSVQMSKFL